MMDKVRILWTWSELSICNSIKIHNILISRTVTTPRDISFIIKVILTVKVTHHTAKVTHPKDRDIHLTVKTTVKGTHLRAQGIHLKDQDIRDMAKDTHHRATLVKDLQARFHGIINFCYTVW